MNLPIDWPESPPKDLLPNEMQLAIEHLKEIVKPDMKEVPGYLLALGVRLSDGILERHGIFLTCIDERRHRMMTDLGRAYAEKYMPVVAVFTAPSWYTEMTEDQLNGGYVRPS